MGRLALIFMPFLLLSYFGRNSKIRKYPQAPSRDIDRPNSAQAPASAPVPAQNGPTQGSGRTIRRGPRSSASSASDARRPNFRTSELPNFRTSELPNFRTSELPNYRTTELPNYPGKG